MEGEHGPRIVRGPWLGQCQQVGTQDFRSFPNKYRSRAYHIAFLIRAPTIRRRGLPEPIVTAAALVATASGRSAVPLRQVFGLLVLGVYYVKIAWFLEEKKFTEFLSVTGYNVIYLPVLVLIMWILLDCGEKFCCFHAIASYNGDSLLATGFNTVKVACFVET